ncbi:MAG: diguanylate cyclase [Anaerolineales bacterium]
MVLQAVLSGQTQPDELIEIPILSIILVTVFIIASRRAQTQKEMELKNTDLQRALDDRRQAEDTLAVQHDLLQALMDNIPDSIYFKDTNSRFTRINRAQVQVLGITSPEDAIGKTDSDFFQSAELVQSFQDEEQRMIETGEPLIDHFEFNPTPDGKPRWFLSTKVPIKNPDGEVIGIVGISHDITAQKQTEDALREAEIKYRALVEHLPAIVYLDQYDPTISAGYRPIYISPQVETVLGYQPVEFIEDPDLWPSLLHPDDRERVLAAEAWHYEAGNFLHQEYHVTARDGHVVSLREEAVLIRDEASGRVFSQGILLDITMHKEAEVALRQSEERFKLISWATTDVVWDWDLQTNQVWWGGGLQRIFHYSPETEQTDHTWWHDHIHPDDRAKVDHSTNQALDGGMEFWSKEYRFQRVDGTYADIMDRAYIIRDTAGKATRMIGAMMDITERKYMESSLRQSNEKMGQFLNELQERNRDTTLLNEMSHLLQGCSSAQEAFGIIADLSNQLFPRTAGALYLLNEPRTQVSTVASWGELPSASPMFTAENCRALRRSPTRLLNEDRPGTCCLHFAQPPGITYCLPIRVQGEILGIFHLQSTSEENLSENKRQLAHSVVERSEMALSNLKLREALLEQSIRDPLTELYNRRYMEGALNQQLSRVTRQLHPLGLIMIDIDHFKNFNDTHGHAAGDALLRELGKLLQSHIRGGDVACRYGGEEFLLIMPDASLEAAHQRAKQLQQEAKGLRVQDAGQSLHGITLSLGVAIYPEHGRSIDSVLRAADAALYRAKQEGRDRVAVAERAS